MDGTRKKNQKKKVEELNKDSQIKKSFLLGKSVSLRPLFPNKDIEIHYAQFRVVEKGSGSLSPFLLNVEIPCRANLFHLVNDLYFPKEEKKTNEAVVEINEDDVSILQMFFTFRKHYSHWREGLKILKEKGRDEARKWLLGKAQMLGLLKAMMPKEET